MNIVKAIKNMKATRPEVTNLGTVTRCPECGAIQFKCLPNVNLQYCMRCGKALDFSGIDFGLYYNDIDIKED